MLAIKVLVFTVLVPGTVVVWLPWRILVRGEWATPAFGPGAVVGALMILAGAAIYARCAWDFAAGGRGTPAPIDPPRTLVVRGLYRRVRNPMYVGVLTTVFGEALVFRSTALLTYGLILWAGFHAVVVLYEERTLERRFGESYADYRRTVRRWLPRLSKP